MTKTVILQVLPALQQGGVERGTVEIATALQKAGIRNFVASQGGKMVAELEALGVEHITLPLKSKNPFTMWRNACQLAKLIREKGITIAHVRSRAPAWSVKWACRWANIPYIATFHGRYGLNALKKVYNRVMTEGRFVVAVSQFIQNHLMTEYGVPAERIRLIPRGADIDVFDPKNVTAEQVQALADEHGISRDKPIITLVGRLTRMKGADVVLDAVKQMKHKDVTILFVGGNAKGDYQERLEAAIATLPPETDVKIFGVAGARMPVVYALSDVVVSASLVPESFGRGIVEAQAMGRMMVAAAHGGPCETISDGKTGFLTPVGDAKAMAQALDKVLDLPQAEREKIEAAAIQSARDNYSIQKMCERTMALYREITEAESVKNDKR